MKYLVKTDLLREILMSYHGGRDICMKNASVRLVKHNDDDDCLFCYRVISVAKKVRHGFLCFRTANPYEDDAAIGFDVYDQLS